MSPAGAANRGLNNAHNVVVVDLECLAQIALQRLLETKKKHPADAHETYFTANGENYRIRIERIPNGKRTKSPAMGEDVAKQDCGDDSGVRRKGESNANT